MEVANYQDPAPGEMGWGYEEDKLQVGQLLAMEALDYDGDPVAGSVDEAKGAGVIPDALLKKIKEKFKFDSGWRFGVVNELVYGRELMMSQNIGNCVGASHCIGLASRIAHEVLAYGELEEPLGKGMLGLPFIPYSYGVGRYVGGFRGWGDGSTCGAQFKGTHTYGILPCFIPGLERYAGSGASALPQGTSSSGRTFGRGKSEWSKWTDHAEPFQLLEGPLVQSVDDAKESVVEKHMPLQICSGWGFRYKGYDSKYGVHLYRPGGSWAHSMSIMGLFEIKGQWFAEIGNQWGSGAHKGSPEIGVPGGHMVISIEDFGRWLRAAHTRAIGQIDGLKSSIEF